MKAFEMHIPTITESNKLHMRNFYIYKKGRFLVSLFLLCTILLTHYPMLEKFPAKKQLSIERSKEMQEILYRPQKKDCRLLLKKDCF